jgi:hypothetical protein
MSEGCYVAGLCIDEALTPLHGGTSNKESFLAALRAADLENAPRGPMKLDERNNPIENVYIFKVQKVNASLKCPNLHIPECLFVLEIQTKRHHCAAGL